MKRVIPMALLVAFATALAFGCSGDVVKSALATPDMQAKVMDMIVGNKDMAGAMVDKLLGGDAKTMVIDKLMANSGAATELVSKVAADTTLMPQVLDIAFKDPAMKTKIAGMLKAADAAAKAAKTAKK